MKHYKETFLKLVDVMTAAEKIENLEQKIEMMGIAIAELRDVGENKWMSLAEAAPKLRTTTKALYQKIKNPTNCIPEKKAWKQKSTGSEIRVHLKTLRTYM